MGFRYAEEHARILHHAAARRLCYKAGLEVLALSQEQGTTDTSIYSRAAEAVAKLEPTGAKREEKLIDVLNNLAEEIEKRGIKDKIHLKKGVIGSERWGEKMRKRISTELGIELYDIYGLTEIYGPGIGINCNHAPRDFPPELQDIAISLRSVTGKAVDMIKPERLKRAAEHKSDPFFHIQHLGYLREL